MIIQHYFEPSVMAHVIRVCGQDRVNNDLGNDIEFLIKSPEGTQAITLLAVEALVSLLRGVDDFRILELSNSVINPYEIWSQNGHLD